MQLIFLFGSILGGYIPKFSVDTINSYNEAKRELLKGLRYLKLWTKMLLCEKGVLRMESDLERDRHAKQINQVRE